MLQGKPVFFATRTVHTHNVTEVFHLVEDILLFHWLTLSQCVTPTVLG